MMYMELERFISFFTYLLFIVRQFLPQVGCEIETWIVNSQIVDDHEKTGIGGMGGRRRTEVKRGGEGSPVYDIPSSRGSLSSPTPLLLLPKPNGQPQLITELSPTFAKIYIALS